LNFFISGKHLWAIANSSQFEKIDLIKE
jgi:hypothetical protein